MTHKEKSKQALQNLGGLASRHGLTHQQIADKIGIHRPTVSNLFAGKFHPTLDNVFRVLNAVNELSGEAYALKDLD
jgi:predicted transcriptional regulator